MDETKTERSEVEDKLEAWAKCPEHGPACGGADCCCTDRHTPKTTSFGPQSVMYDAVEEINDLRERLVERLDEDPLADEPEGGEQSVFCKCGHPTYCHVATGISDDGYRHGECRACDECSEFRPTDEPESGEGVVEYADQHRDYWQDEGEPVTWAVRFVACEDCPVEWIIYNQSNDPERTAKKSAAAKRSVDYPMAEAVPLYAGLPTHADALDGSEMTREEVHGADADEVGERAVREHDADANEMLADDLRDAVEDHPEIASELQVAARALRGYAARLRPTDPPDEEYEYKSPRERNREILGRVDEDPLAGDPDEEEGDKRTGPTCVECGSPSVLPYCVNCADDQPGEDGVGERCGNPVQVGDDPYRYQCGREAGHAGPCKRGEKERTMNTNSEPDAVYVKIGDEVGPSAIEDAGLSLVHEAERRRPCDHGPSITCTRCDPTDPPDEAEDERTRQYRLDARFYRRHYENDLPLDGCHCDDCMSERSEEEQKKMIRELGEETGGLSAPAPSTAHREEIENDVIMSTDDPLIEQEIRVSVWDSGGLSVTTAHPNGEGNESRTFDGAEAAIRFVRDALDDQAPGEDAAGDRCQLCGHLWRKHDPEDGECDAHATVEGHCPCGRDFKWMREQMAAFSVCRLSDHPEDPDEGENDG